MKPFKSVLEFQKYFDTDEKCRQHLEQERWNGKPTCPFCNSENVHRFPNNKTFKCRDCRKKFSVTVGTPYENTKLPLTKWYLASYILTNHSKGISALQLSNWLDCTVKTVWFLDHRIRLMLEEKEPSLLDKEVEADETYVGGRAENIHKSKRKKREDGTFEPLENKTPVLAMVERGGKVVTKVVKNVTGEELQDFIQANVKEGATVYTDELKGYKGLSKKYTHESVNHSTGEYVRGRAHINTAEGFFSMLKKQIVGIHHSVSPKHLQRYCNESAYRWNRRLLTQDDKFNEAIKNCSGRRLKYKQLVGKNQ